jgi:hypothetical protein
MKIFSCFLLLLYVNNNYAQDGSEILLKADDVVSSNLTPEKIYQYPKFSHGKIIFKDQTSTEAQINYNYLNGEIEFIGPAKDTMTIAEQQMQNIQRIIVNNDTFFYDDAYIQHVLATPLGILAKRTTLVVVLVQKLGAYDRPTSTVKPEYIVMFKDYGGSSTIPDLVVRENITLAYRSEYFFGNNSSKFLPVNKKNLLKLLPSKNEMINRYLKENNVNYKKRGDVEKLILSLQ